jgi:hypothetical protein
MSAEEDFQTAYMKFRTFLTQNGHGKEPLWIFREDVIAYKRRVWLRWPLPARNRKLVEQLYEQGRQGEFGVSLTTYCVAGYHACCYVFVPDNELDASYAMLQAGLKLSVGVNMPIAQKVSSKPFWWLLSLINLATRRYWDDQCIHFRKSLGQNITRL